jgi:hypothetical protein
MTDEVATSTVVAEAAVEKNEAAEKDDGNRCCPEVGSARLESFDEKSIMWTNKPFIKEKAWCFLYMPLNFRGAMTRACKKIDLDDAKVSDDEFIMLCDMISPWSTRILLSVSKPLVMGAEMVSMSGTFLTKVFEGPYKDFDKWIKEMKTYVKKEKGQDFNVDSSELWYAYYMTCPRCAKKYGKNYTVLFVKVA